ncbi:hypothetical protein ZWY2020_049665 [Hordeum vulgare]|nr:hypothetical protein ZWY2020_049665 [Hordeum vulgare]
MTEGYSGSDLKNLCVTAAYRPVRELLKKERLKEMERRKTEVEQKTLAKQRIQTSQRARRPLTMGDLRQAKNQVAATSLKSTNFPLELQEAILIWHIATDLFLSCYHNVVPAAPQNDEKAIKAMSDYMMFLLAKQPKDAAGLKLRIDEKARATLREIGKIKEEDKPSSSYTTTKEQKAKELATWMLENVDHLEDKSFAISRGIKENRLWGLGTLEEGTQIALFLSDGKHRLIGNAMKKSVRKLGYWIRTLQELREDMNDNDMLKFIVKAWVHLLMYASIRGSTEAHAKQLSEGGGLTTLVWIISEHEEESGYIYLQTMAKLRQRYDDLKERYAVFDVTVSLQNVASQLGYSSIDSLSLEDTVVEIVSRIEKLMQAKTMMEAAGKPE